MGIDSIKRVEILSTMQERAPSLPEVDGSSMATLQTLGEIVGFMSPTDATQRRHRIRNLLKRSCQLTTPRQQHQVRRLN